MSEFFQNTSNGTAQRRGWLLQQEAVGEVRHCLLKPEWRV